MAKPELGAKRQCLNCGTRFYDLSRDPIICPKCGTVFQVAALTAASRARAAAAPVAAVAEDEVEVDPATAVADFVPLEDAEAAETKDVPTDDIEEDIGVAEEDTFLEPEEEGEDDVADLIDGDIENDEEA